MCAPFLVLACPFSSCPLLPPGSLPPFFVLVFLCLCSVLPLLCCPLSLFLLPLFSGALTSFGCSLSLRRCSRVFFLCLGASVPCSALNLFCVFRVLLIDCGPRRSSLLSPCACPPLFWCWCGVCRALFLLLLFAAVLVVLVVFCVCWVCLFREVGPAPSHGLDRTAANFTGAGQLSSLPCCPERPRAAKSAHMVRSVGSNSTAKMALWMGALHLCMLLRLFTDNVGRTALLRTVLGR